jgi:hypothetical protein
LLESALIPMSYKKKACAFARKRPCHAPPDSSARAGNERDLAGELHPEASSSLAILSVQSMSHWHAIVF